MRRSTLLLSGLLVLPLLPLASAVDAPDPEVSACVPPSTISPGDVTLCAAKKTGKGFTVGSGGDCRPAPPGHQDHELAISVVADDATLDASFSCSGGGPE